jgi:hypothetical protein
MMRQQDNDLLFHIVTLKVQGFFTASWTSASVWSCDHQYTSSQDRKHKSYLVPSLGCMIDSRQYHPNCCYMAAISQAVWGSCTVMQKNIQMVHDIVMIYLKKLPIIFSCSCALAQRYHITVRTSAWDHVSRLFANLNCFNCAPVMCTWFQNESRCDNAEMA